jgi:hypothetical protein
VLVRPGDGGGQRVGFADEDLEAGEASPSGVLAQITWLW